MQRRFYFLLIVATLLLAGNASAQSRDAATVKRLHKTDEVNGASSTIYLHSDARDAADAYYEGTDRKTSFRGYRVRIYSGGTQKARKEAENTIESFRKKYTEPVYYSYVNPNFVVTCGNFINLEEAVIFFEKVVKSYPTAQIVVCEIPANTFVRTTPASIKAAKRNEVVMEESDPGYDMLMSSEDLAGDPEWAAALAKEEELMANIIEYLPSKELIEQGEAESALTEEAAIAKAAEAEAAAAARDQH